MSSPPEEILSANDPLPIHKSSYSVYHLALFFANTLSYDATP